MEIILLKEVDKVGYKYELVKVKSGYARNFLIPQGLALIANTTNRKRLAELRRLEAAKESKLLGHYQEIAEKVKGITLKIGAKAGATGKIFGSVTNVQIVQALQEQLQIEIERRKIIIEEEVKELGSYSATLKLHPEVETKVGFEVIQE